MAKKDKLNEIKNIVPTGQLLHKTVEEVLEILLQLFYFLADVWKVKAFLKNVVAFHLKHRRVFLKDGHLFKKDDHLFSIQLYAIRCMKMQWSYYDKTY